MSYLWLWQRRRIRAVEEAAPNTVKRVRRLSRVIVDFSVINFHANERLSLCCPGLQSPQKPFSSSSKALESSDFAIFPPRREKRAKNRAFSALSNRRFLFHFDTLGNQSQDKVFKYWIGYRSSISLCYVSAGIFTARETNQFVKQVKNEPWSDRLSRSAPTHQSIWVQTVQFRSSILEESKRLDK